MKQFAIIKCCAWRAGVTFFLIKVIQSDRSWKHLLGDVLPDDDIEDKIRENFESIINAWVWVRCLF